VRVQIYLRLIVLLVMVKMVMVTVPQVRRLTRVLLIWLISVKLLPMISVLENKALELMERQCLLGRAY